MISSRLQVQHHLFAFTTVLVGVAIALPLFYCQVCFFTVKQNRLPFQVSGY